MRLLFALVAALLFAPLAAHAQTTTTQGCHGASYQIASGQLEDCTQVYVFSGTCTGADMWNLWSSVGGSPPSISTWYVSPWEYATIYITSIDILDLTPSDGHTGWDIGNGYVADNMAMLPAGQNFISRSFFPSVWQNPARGTLTPGHNPLIDLHGGCAAGQTASVQIAFHYFGGATSSPSNVSCLSGFDTMNPADKSAHIVLSSGNLTVTNDGFNGHALVRAMTGIAPGTISAHWEWTLSGVGSGGLPIDVVGIQDGTVSTDTQVGTAGTGTGQGYSAGNGYVYSDGFTGSSGSSPPMVNGIWAADYNSATGSLTITGPLVGSAPVSMTETATGTPPTLYPAVSLYGSPAGTVTFNFGQAPFAYPVPSGYQAGLCQ